MKRVTRLSVVATASIALVAGPALSAVAAPKGKGPKSPAPGASAVTAYDAAGDVAVPAADISKVLVQVTSSTVRATFKVAEVPAVDGSSYAVWSFAADAVSTAGVAPFAVSHDSLGTTTVTGLDGCAVTAVTRPAEVQGEAAEVVVSVPRACLVGVTSLTGLAASATGSDAVLAPEPVQDVVESLAGRSLRVGSPVRTKGPKTPKSPKSPKGKKTRTAR